MTTTIKGELEIDHRRGVIYFHSEKGYTVLRICRLPKPIPKPNELLDQMLDITQATLVNWRTLTCEDAKINGEAVRD